MVVISTMTELLSLCQDEANAPICLVTVLKNNDNLVE